MGLEQAQGSERIQNPMGVETGLEQSVWSSTDLVKNLCQSNGEPSNTLGDGVIKKKKSGFFFNLSF